MAGGLAIDGIGEFGAELFQVDLVDTTADLLVRREQKLDDAMGNGRIGHQPGGGGDDFSKAGLVVGAEQRRAVGGDDIIADLVGQRPVFGDADDLACIAWQHDVAALVIAQELRLDASAGEIGRRIHMRAEADDRNRLVDGRGNGGVDIAVLVQMRILKADGQQFLDQQAGERLLLAGRGLAGRARIGLGVDHGITKEAVGHGIGHLRLLSFYRL